MSALEKILAEVIEENESLRVQIKMANEQVHQLQTDPKKALIYAQRDLLRTELGKAREALQLVKQCGALTRDPRYGDMEANDELLEVLRSIDESGVLK